MHRMILLAALVAALAAGCSEPAGPEPIRLPYDLHARWEMRSEGITWTETIVATSSSIEFMGMEFVPQYATYYFNGRDPKTGVLLSGNFAGRDRLALRLSSGTLVQQYIDCTRK